MQIKLHRNFLKRYIKLPEKIREKFKEKRNLFIEDRFDPILNNHSVEKRFPDCRSINITGDYRAIFKEEKGDIYIFINIGTHSELY